MQFTIDVRPTGDGWQVQVIDPQTGQPRIDPNTGQPILSRPRIMCRSAAGDDAFPLPSEGDPPAISAAGLPAGWTAADLPAKVEAMFNQSSAPGDVARFGQYLFNTLLGRPLWDRLDAIAGKEPLELALSWPADDGALNRLPWEIMYNGAAAAPLRWEGFLAGNPDVSITRRVQGATGVVTNISSPPKVLFVVGSGLEDPVIRAGAEYMGLLRYLKVEGKDRRLRTRILLGATTTSLQAAIKAYRPSVVHIICHGVTDDAGEPALEFRLKEGDDKSTLALTAEGLLESLRTDENLPLPAVVVLNACATGTSEELRVGRPLAARLVAHIPIVVGMTGMIADQACRLFTKGFYGALLAGGDVAQAAARGRRAAIAHGTYDPTGTVDWALPALFLSEAMGEARVDLQADASEIERLDAAERFLDGYAYPAFCDRWEVFRLYDRLLQGDGLQFIGIYKSISDNTNPALPDLQLGRSYLLREMASQALRDGHVPILVSKARKWLNKLDDQAPWPATLWEFLDKVAQATNRTLEILRTVRLHESLDPRWPWPNLQAVGQNPAPSFGVEPIDRQAEAFRLDLLGLLGKVAAQRPAAERDGVRLVLLLDDVHRMTFAGDLLRLLGLSGLRAADARQRIRCVFAYSAEPITGQEDAVKEIADFARSTDVELVKLAPFHQGIQPNKPRERPGEYERAKLIYKHFLLYWQYQNRSTPLTLAVPEGNALVDSLIGGLARVVDGYPSRLTSNAVEEKVFTYWQELNPPVLRDADDEAALADLAALPKR